MDGSRNRADELRMSLIAPRARFSAPLVPRDGDVDDYHGARLVIVPPQALVCSGGRVV